MLDHVGGRGRYADIEVNHEIGQSLAIDENHLRADARCVVDRIGRVDGRRDEQALLCALALEGPNKLLNLRPTYRTLPAFGLNENRVEAEAVLLDDSVDASIAGLPNAAGFDV